MLDRWSFPCGERQILFGGFPTGRPRYHGAFEQPPGQSLLHGIDGISQSPGEGNKHDVGISFFDVIQFAPVKPLLSWRALLPSFQMCRNMLLPACAGWCVPLTLVAPSHPVPTKSQTFSGGSENGQPSCVSGVAAFLNPKPLAWRLVFSAARSEKRPKR